MANEILLVEANKVLSDDLGWTCKLGCQILHRVRSFDHAERVFAEVQHPIVLVDACDQPWLRARTSRFLEHVKKTSPRTRAALIGGAANDGELFDACVMQITDLGKRVEDWLDEHARSQRYLRDAVNTGSRIADEFMTIDWVGFETASAQKVVPAIIADYIPGVRELMIQAGRLIARLPELVLDSSAIDSIELRRRLDSMLADDKAGACTEGFPLAEQDPYCEDLDSAYAWRYDGGRPDSDYLLFMCELGHSELAKSARRIARASRNRCKWELIDECAEACRRASKSLRVCLDLAAKMVEPSLGLSLEDITELEVSLQVRPLLGALRMDLLTYIPPDVAQRDDLTVLAAADAARQRMRRFFEAPAYRWVRVQDRFALCSSFEKLPTRKSLRPDAESRRALYDLRKMADGLQSVNRRAMLERYDRDVVERSIGALREARDESAKPYGWALYSTVLDDLQIMSYRDSAVDRVVREEQDVGFIVGSAMNRRIDRLLGSLANVRV